MIEKHPKLVIKVKSARDLTSEEYAEILMLCTQAFEHDYEPYMKTFENLTHVLGKYHGKLVSHVLWITRWLQIDDGPLLRTAYIEATATHLKHRHRGFASKVMKKAAEEIQDYDIAALATGSPAFYARLGWRLWRGPLFLRKGQELVPTPEEHGVMVLALERTPPFDINAPLSIEWRELEPW